MEKKLGVVAIWITIVHLAAVGQAESPVYGHSPRHGSRQSPRDGTTARPWFRQALVGMEVGPTGAQFGHSDPEDGRYCARFDGRQIVRHCVEAKCDYVVVWARDGDYAYYDSKLLPKAPGLGGRDPLRETVAEAAKHKLPVIAYCVVQQGGHYLREHPEFETRDSASSATTAATST